MKMESMWSTASGQEENMSGPGMSGVADGVPERSRPIVSPNILYANKHQKMPRSGAPILCGIFSANIARIDMDRLQCLLISDQ